jgi:hypothetical protein
MKVLTIALAISVPFVIAALNAWLNIKIKFAPDAAHAAHEVKLVCRKVFLWIANAYSAGVIVWLFVFWPIDRLFILAVMVNSFGLFHSYLMYWLDQVWISLRKHTDTDESLADAVSSLTTAVNALSKIR